MIHAVEEEWLQQLSIPGNRARPQPWNIRTLRQAGENDEAAEAVPAEAMGRLERTERRCVLVASSPEVRGYTASPSRCRTSASVTMAGVACCGSPIDKRIGASGGVGTPESSARSFSKGYG